MKIPTGQVENRKSVVRRSLRPTPFAPRPTAFTLVELLVVIAIMSLLLSILLPSLNHAQELAQKVLCASQLKHIGVAYVSYTNDWRRYFPICYDSTPPGQGAWYQFLSSYLDCEGFASDEVTIYTCPTQDGMHGGSSTKKSYGQNTFVENGYHLKDGVVTPNNTTTIRKTTDPEKPEETCLAADGYYHYITHPTYSGYWTAHLAYTYMPEAPHSEGTNILMCDFSVQWWLGDDVPCSAHGSTADEINRFWRGY